MAVFARKYTFCSAIFARKYTFCSAIIARIYTFCSAIFARIYTFCSAIFARIYTFCSAANRIRTVRPGLAFSTSLVASCFSGTASCPLSVYRLTSISAPAYPVMHSLSRRKMKYSSASFSPGKKSPEVCRSPDTSFRSGLRTVRFPPGCSSLFDCHTIRANRCFTGRSDVSHFPCYCSNRQVTLLSEQFHFRLFLYSSLSSF